jgi:hypothetical protein
MHVRNENESLSKEGNREAAIHWILALKLSPNRCH